jgi:hypothetical protein
MSSSKIDATAKRLAGIRTGVIRRLAQDSAASAVAAAVFACAALLILAWFLFLSPYAGAPPFVYNQF